MTRKRTRLVPDGNSPSMDELTARFYPMCHALAVERRWCADDHEDLVHTGLIGLWEGVRGAQERGKVIECLEAFAATCIRRAMNDFYKAQDRNYKTVCVADPSTLPLIGEDAHFERVAVDAFLGEVERLWGSSARQMCELLMEPGGPVVDVVMRDHAKRVRRRKRGELVKGATEVVVRNHHIRAAMGVTWSEWHRHKNNIRAFARAYFGLDDDKAVA